MRKVIAAAVGLGLVLGLTGCDVANGYVEKAKKVAGADNMEEQYKRVMTDYNALQTTADNACAAQASASEDNDPTLVEDPALAYKATYRTIWVDYNTRMNNIFEAQKVGPIGYPRRIPNYVTGAKPNFCTVSDQLVQLKEEAEQG